MIQVNLKNDNTRIVRREQTVEVFSHQGPDGSWENYDAARCEEIARAIKDQGPDGAVQLEGIPFEVRWGARATSSRVATCVEIKFTARPRRRDAPDTPVDLHTVRDDLLQALHVDAQYRVLLDLQAARPFFILPRSRVQ